MISQTLRQLTLVGFFLCLHVLSNHAYATMDTSGCPANEDDLTHCMMNRTEILTTLYSLLAAPGDPTHCASRNALSHAYSILAFPPHQIRFGYDFDYIVFKNCDWLSDDRYCPVDVQQTICTCAASCSVLNVASNLVDIMQDYPDWKTTGVPWNGNRLL
jgi:hypothetical protein